MHSLTGDGTQVPHGSRLLRTLAGTRIGFSLLAWKYKILYTVKKVSDFPVPSL